MTELEARARQRRRIMDTFNAHPPGTVLEVDQVATAAELEPSEARAAMVALEVAGWLRPTRSDRGRPAWQRLDTPNGGAPRPAPPAVGSHGPRPLPPQPVRRSGPGDPFHCRRCHATVTGPEPPRGWYRVQQRHPSSSVAAQGADLRDAWPVLQPGMPGRGGGRVGRDRPGWSGEQVTRAEAQTRALEVAGRLLDRSGIQLRPGVGRDQAVAALARALYRSDPFYTDHGRLLVTALAQRTLRWRRTHPPRPPAEQAVRALLAEGAAPTPKAIHAYQARVERQRHAAEVRYARRRARIEQDGPRAAAFISDFWRAQGRTPSRAELRAGMGWPADDTGVIVQQLIRPAGSRSARRVAGRSGPAQQPGGQQPGRRPWVAARKRQHPRGADHRGCCAAPRLSRCPHR